MARSRNLSYRLDDASGDEVGTTAKSVNGLLSTFHSGMGEVREAIYAIGGVVNSMDAGAAESQTSVDHMHEEIEQLGVSMEASEGQIRSSSDVAEEASATAQQGAEYVVEGSSRSEATSSSIAGMASDLETTAEALPSLKTSGDEVSKFVGTIPEIADQTNLLALYATIEAARAGESGRGKNPCNSGLTSPAEEINSILDMIVSSITNSVATREPKQERAEESVALASGTVESLDAIQHRILTLGDEC